MARPKNDGRGRLGGRAKGTPNKINSDVKNWIVSVLANGKGKFEDCFEYLPPSDYVKAYISLMNFVVPKQQAATPEMTFEAEYKQMKLMLEQLPDEYLDEISKRIIKLKNEAEKRR
jgi:hypothetical protein